MSGKTNSFDFNSLLQVFIIILLLANLVFVANFFQTNDITIQIKSKQATSENLTDAGQKNPALVDATGNNIDLTNQNNTGSNAVINAPEKGVDEAKKQAEAQNYRQLEITPELEQKILAITETNETVQS